MANNDSDKSPDRELDTLSEEIEAIMDYVGRRAKNNPNLKGRATLPSLVVTDNEVVFEDVPYVKTRQVPSKQVHLIISPKVPADQEETKRNELLVEFSGAIPRSQLSAYKLIHKMLMGVFSEKEKKEFLSNYRKRLNEAPDQQE